MQNLLSGGELKDWEQSMLKKITSLLIVGAILVGCDDTVPAGGRGYFDQVGNPPPAPLQPQQPVNIVPQTQGPGDMTDSLSAAVNEALTTTAPANATNTQATPGVDPVTGVAIVTDDGSIDLNQFSLDQQIVDRNEAARVLAEARANRVIIEPGQLPTAVADVNIAAFARETTNLVGERQHRRPVIRTRSSECRKFSAADDAQRYFLANGGPQEDPLNLDGDGDGFACSWDPTIYRQLR